MRAVRIIDGERDFTVQDLAASERRPGGAVVRMEAAMVASYMGALPSGAWMTPPRPFTPGQCAVGVVEEGTDRLPEGQRVYFDAFTGGRSEADPAADHGFLGCFAVGEAALRDMSAWPDGSFAELIHAPEACFTPLPDTGLSPQLLCRLGWLGTAYRGLEAGGGVAGRRIAINGATGVVGASAVVLALALGAAEIHVFGRNADRMAEIVALDPARVSPGSSGSDAVFDLMLDCASGAAGETSSALVSRLRRFGRAVFVGGHSGPMTLDTAALMRNSNAVIGSYWFEREDLRRLIGMVKGGVLDLSAFRARAFGIGKIHDAIHHAATSGGGLEHTVLIP